MKQLNTINQDRTLRTLNVLQGFVDKQILGTIFILLVKWFLFAFFNEIPFTKSAIFTYTGFLLAAGSLACLLGKYKIVYLFVLNGLMTINLFANSMYIGHFGSPMTIYTLLQVKNINGLGGSIFSYLRIEYILFFLDLLFVLVFVRHKLSVKSPKQNSIKNFLFYFVCGLLLFPLQPIIVHSEEEDPASEYSESNNIEQFSIIGYQFYDIYSFIRDSNEELDPDEKREIQHFFDVKNQMRESDRHEKYPFGFGRGKNLILIQVESLQNFVINYEYNGQEVTPNLNRILDHSLYFPKTYPQTIEGNSSDAELLTQTSLYPIAKGSVFYRYPDNSYFSLGDMLQEEGYSTVAIHADEATYWNRDQIYPELGFQQYLSIEDFDVEEEVGMGLGDIPMFYQSAGKLQQIGQPFYSFIITLTNHMPFDLPEEYRELDLPEDLDSSLLGGYLQSVHYTDKSIGIFLEELESRGLLDDSIVVLYGDHNGIFEKDKPLVEEYLTEKMINEEEWIREYVPVPFIIYHPDLEGEVIDTIGGQIDMLPTVAYVMGMDPQKLYYTFGKNLLLTENGSAIIPKGDYSTKPSYLVTKNIIYQTLPEFENKILEISDLMIRSNFLEGELE